jgi:pSer/pThr/pTyr-binding forkhead associated (FHA) protein
LYWWESEQNQALADGGAIMKVWLQAHAAMEGMPEIRVDRFPFVIGRRSESDCALPLAFVSRRHCQFTREGNRVFVQDLESYNGTFLNGRRATVPLPVENGDELNLGPITFRVLVQRTSVETQMFCISPTREEPALAGLG